MIFPLRMTELGRELADARARRGLSLEELSRKTEQQIFFNKPPTGTSLFEKLSPGEEIFYRKDGTCFAVEVNWLQR